MLKTLLRGTVATKKAHIKLLEMRAAAPGLKSVLEQVKSRFQLAEGSLSLKVFLEEQSKMKQQEERGTSGILFIKGNALFTSCPSDGLESDGPVDGLWACFRLCAITAKLQGRFQHKPLCR